eukprot:Rhum_TRINITY_DN2974_c0_g1::Rhum_TRINITY_DN2974_c0_g1_i1::g.9074::m.9074
MDGLAEGVCDAPDPHPRDVVKRHHLVMRKRLRNGKSVSEVWNENLECESELLGYARAMKGLGDEWRGKGDERVEWVLRTVRDYFRGSADGSVGEVPCETSPSHSRDTAVPSAKRAKLGAEVSGELPAEGHVPGDEGDVRYQADAAPAGREGPAVSGLVKHLLKSKRRDHWRLHNAPMDEEKEAQCALALSEEYDIERSARIKLLDVGSCYNPFAESPLSEGMDVLPIDLCPVPSSSVFKGDFSSMPFETLEQQYLLNASTNTVAKLKICGFDVVAFCLVLSYMPCPRMRFRCLEQAFTALRLNGLLVIVTTKTVGKKDLSWLKPWHATLTALSFVKVAQEIKQKIVCMAYRKASEDPHPPTVPCDLATIPIGADTSDATLE